MFRLLNKIEKIANSIEELLKNEPCVLNIYVNDLKDESILEVFIDTEEFFNKFKYFLVKKRDCSDFPYRAYLKGDNFIIYTILDQKEFENYVKKVVV